MEECSHVLCLWEGRLWPAKVLPKSDRNFRMRRRKDIEVEILGEDKRVRIAEEDSWPLTLDSINSLCLQLAQPACQPMEELRYRKALRLALEILSADSSQSPRRSYRLSPASSTMPRPVPSPCPPGTPKLAAQTVPKVRSTPGSQQGAAASSGSTGAETGSSGGRNQGGARAGRGHASPNPAQVKSARASHRNRKQRKRGDPRQNPPSRHGQRGGVSVEAGHTDLVGCDSAEATPTTVATPTDPPSATPMPRWTSAIRGRRSPRQASSSHPAAEMIAALPSPIKCGSDSGLSTPTRPTHRLLRKHLLSSTPDGSRLANLRPSLHPSESPESAPAQDSESEVKLSYRKRRNQAREPQVTNGRGQLKGRRGQRKCGASDTSPATKRRKGFCVEAGKTVARPTQSTDSGTRPPARHRARFEPAEESDVPGETSLSSDLSIELSFLEDSAPLDSSLQEVGEDEGEDEELPSFLLQIEKKPLSITEGICVWCKLRSYPFWPAMVKSVNRKDKKATVVFIDSLLLDKKSSQKGIRVSLRTLKPFDCVEMDELVVKAREKYNTAISWCLTLIRDYRIRIGSGSFSGSFIEYFADDISWPVRRRCMPGGAEVTFPTKWEEEGVAEEEQGVAEVEQGVASSPEGDQQDQAKRQRSRKLMPDREKAGRDRANQKLVHFIVQKRGLEHHLQAVLSGRESSRWLRSFLRAGRSVMGVYLEDDGQVDQVYQYLRQVYNSAPDVAPCLAQVDEVRFITDVLLPEAIIHAIAEVEDLSLKEAESKYLNGACKSERERAEFDLMIEQQLKAKRQRQREQEDLT
ncbi:hypothetical protein SKAU_G00117020 [Synaphobranchus kaupii]|uniref:PWWP domain-containing protein MUM1-like n=1 Tax=Synaphobranchus kaupii TaxID=118154 RepID=A0A9Q1J1N2_SYNKA|nr:hypothetical protein SKAU_G00117020 [Synaphobranchus kaupii]